MGFEAPKTVYRLEFDDPIYADLVIKVRAATVSEMIEASALDTDVSEETTQAQLIKTHEKFISKVTEWNLTENGNDVPITLEGLYAQELPFVSMVVNTWMRGEVEVSDPLDQGSSNTSLSLEASMPMDVSLESLAS